MNVTALEQVKQKLYVEYARELDALIKQGASCSTATASSNEDAGTRNVTKTEQLLPGVTARYSYLRQRLLCLRAAGVLPITPEHVSPGLSSMYDSSSSSSDAHFSASLHTASSVREKSAASENYDIFRTRINEAPRLQKMHALQEQSLQTLRKNALLLTDLRCAQRPDDTSRSSSSGKENDTEKNVGSIRNMAVLRDNAGRSGDEFAAQRLSVLTQLEDQLKRERVTREARQLVTM